MSVSLIYLDFGLPSWSSANLLALLLAPVVAEELVEDFSCIACQCPQVRQQVPPSEVHVLHVGLELRPIQALRLVLDVAEVLQGPRARGMAESQSRRPALDSEFAIATNVLIM
ncbi:hypothetical protein JTE90_013532 [Oedothorax gibbosus]|uniref:Secreted protein n=1 Tax=Oedothorax gibbosus TaxID=931172 RepID=A0AAV6U9F5_9ARAC|nr:hypothetical protein JTE90_013532 [Oedothorax gibbosus]